MHPRGLNPGGTCSLCRCGARRGACPQRCRFGWRWRHPAGGLLSLSPAYPAFSLLFRPPSPKGKDIPPPPFPAGRGRLKVILCKGLRPLHPRGLNPGGTCSLCRCGARRGACPQRCRFGWRWRHPAGGLLSLSPAYPAFSLLFRPPSPKGKDIPPPPFPAGRGRLKVILCKGLRPLHPRGLNPGGTGYPCRCGRLNGGQFPPAALVRPAPGERTISNAAVALATDSSISPGPPLSLAAGFAHRETFLSILRSTEGFLLPPFTCFVGRTSAAQGKPPSGTCSAGTISAASGSAAGMQGAKPLA